MKTYPKGFIQTTHNNRSSCEVTVGDSQHTSDSFCPNCKARLYRLCEIDRDVLERVSDCFSQERLRLFCCWQCSTFTNVVYKDNGADLQYLLIDSKWQQEGWPPYDPYPQYFPSKVLRLNEDLPEVQSILTSSHSFEDAHELWRVFEARAISPNPAWPHFQIGGFPFLIAPVVDDHCAHCGTELTFLASVPSCLLGEPGYMGFEFGQILYMYCEDCFGISLVHQYD